MYLWFIISMRGNYSIKRAVIFIEHEKSHETGMYDHEKVSKIS